MRRFLLVTAAALTLSSAALAMDFTPPSTDLSKAHTGRYTIDPSHANVLFNLSHMGYSHYFGRFNKLEGTLDFDNAKPENSKLNVTIYINSIDTNNSKLQAELVSKNWFDADQFAKATFTSTSIQKTSDTTGKVTGDLTLHGVTKPVTLDVTFNGAGTKPIVNSDALGFSATGSFKRSDFGISQYVPLVGDDVALTIEAEFDYKPAGAPVQPATPNPKKK